MTRTVALFIEAAVPNPWIQGLAQLLNGPDQKVTVGSLHPAGPLQQQIAGQGLRTFALGVTRRWQYPMAVTRLTRLLRTERVALLHSLSFDTSFVAMVAHLFGGGRWIYTYFHQPGFFDLAPMAVWKRPLVKAVDRLIARSADAIVSTSRPVRIELERMGIPPAKIHDVPVGIDIASLEARAAADLDTVCRELDLTGRLVVLSVGRLSWEKDHQTTLRAWPAIVRRYPRALLLIAGGGPLGVEMDALAAELGIADSVRVLGPRRDAPALMAAASILVHVARTESFGQVIAEAMSLGTPVVVTATGVGAELVDGVDGLLVPMGNSDALRAAVIRLADDAKLAAALGEQGRRVARERFTLESNAVAFRRIYAQLLDESSPPRARLT